MAPVRSYYNWNQRKSDTNEAIEPYRKYFFICEGAKILKRGISKSWLTIKKNWELILILIFAFSKRLNKIRIYLSPEDL